MKLLKTAILFIATTSFIQAQNCKAYIPYEEGTKLEMTNYDKKGKVTGKVNQEITKVESVGNATSFTMHQVFTDEKGENTTETDMTFKCEDNVFYIDMNSFISGEQMAAYEDMDMEIEMNEIDIPTNLTPGQKLKDGKITMKLVTDSPIAMNFTVDVLNRKVEKFETITTPAGKFECVKLTQDINSKFGFSITINSIEWYAEGVGAVKTETYRKGKLVGTTELTKMEKP